MIGGSEDCGTGNIGILGERYPKNPGITGVGTGIGGAWKGDVAGPATGNVGNEATGGPKSVA